MSPAKRERAVALWRHALAAVAIGILFGFLGPFGTTSTLTTAERYGFWVGLILFGYVCVAAAWLVVAAVPRLAVLAIPARVALLALLSAVPMTFATAWALTQVQPERIVDAARLPALFAAVASVQLVLAIAAIGLRNGPSAVAVATKPQRPQFMLRIPLHLGTELIAVEGHDHYLRVHTTLGADLILCRLADALNELAGVDGLQVHRSWWVAADAVAGLVREDGRTFILMRNGLRVPISRTHMRAVRARGWRAGERRPALG